jgi:transcriptional regulator with XRE-family HTH domain
MYNNNQLYEYVGKRILESRSLPHRKITQSELGKLIGVTFQQIQKYEKAVNRVPLCSLLKISKHTKKPLTFFLPLEHASYTLDKPVELTPADTDPDVREFIENNVFRNP